MTVIANVSMDTIRQSESILAFLIEAIENPKALKAVLAELNSGLKMSDDLMAKKQEAEDKIKEAKQLADQVVVNQKEFEKAKAKSEKELEAATTKLAAAAENFAVYKGKVEEQIVLINQENEAHKEGLKAEAKKLAAEKADIEAKAKEVAKAAKEHADAVAKFDAYANAKVKELDERDAAITTREDVFRNVAKQLG